MYYNGRLKLLAMGVLFAGSWPGMMDSQYAPI